MRDKVREHVLCMANGYTNIADAWYDKVCAMKGSRSRDGEKYLISIDKSKQPLRMYSSWMFCLQFLTSTINRKNQYLLETCLYVRLAALQLRDSFTQEENSWTY